MDFRITLPTNKIRVISRQAINLNVNPNEERFAPQSGKQVKVQIARTKQNLRKAFAQKPDEYIPAEAAEEKVIPNRLRQLTKLEKHKRKTKVNVHKKHKTPKQKSLFEKDMQEFPTPFIFEEEQKWIDTALRNHNYSLDYKPLEEHYRSEIEKGFLRAKLAKDGYAKANKAKTQAYFNMIKTDEDYINKLFWKEVISSGNKKSIIVNLNNKLLPF
ncbi:hypothetical protein J6P92_07165 [bacterium]|nr:hypothetical protein [bacterium]